jgi:hypothetical protein
MAASEPVQDSAKADARNTHFDFQAKVFQAPGAHFTTVSRGQGKTKAVMFAVELGTGEGLISLKHLRESFGIAPGSHDDQLIERAEAGLRYVPDIRPGDAIPTELLDGTASWTVSRKHKRIARERIQGQLLAWMNGSPLRTKDPKALEKLLETPETKKMLREAFRRAAVELGLAAEETDKVVDRIETLARELCYIEALRESVDRVRRIRVVLERLVKVYDNDARMVAEIGRCRKLIVEGVRELTGPLAAIDARIADVMAALQTIDAAITEIRRTRDELHHIMMEWDPVVARWKDLRPVKSKPTEQALQTLYQLLAGRFATGKSLLSRGR